MLHRVLFFCVCSFVLGGCVYKDEPMPAIVGDYGLSKSVPQELLKPVNPPTFPRMPDGWQPPSGFEVKWTAIIVHHSGTNNGNSAVFDRWHKEGNHWEGVGYDFVIGNGTDSGDGEVETTFRWYNQKVGAHCGGTPGNWANREGIGVCLVGDFNKTLPTERQMASLTKLIRFLMNRYQISNARIYGHNTAPGARATDCPGKRFPMTKLKATLDF